MDDRLGAANDWDRWRGRVDAAIEITRDALNKVDKWRVDHERQMAADAQTVSHRFNDVHSRITRIELRVAYYAGGASLLGGLLAGLLTFFLRRI